MLTEHAVSLGLTTQSIITMGIGWSADYGAWSYPMRDHTRRVVGIRLRRPDGRKFCVKGSREGLFIPSSVPMEETLFIVEGATDAAAMLDMGLTSVVGRPSCTGGTKLLVEFVRQRPSLPVVIIADADPPGLRGADDLSQTLTAHVRDLRLIAPPAGITDQQVANLVQPAESS